MAKHSRRSDFENTRPRRAGTALAALAAFGLGVVATPSAKAQSLSVLYNFTGSPDGANPPSEP